MGFKHQRGYATRRYDNYGSGYDCIETQSGANHNYQLEGSIRDVNPHQRGNKSLNNGFPASKDNFLTSERNVHNYRSKKPICGVKDQRGNASLSNDFHAIVDYYIETPGACHSYKSKGSIRDVNPHQRGDASLNKGFLASKDNFPTSKSDVYNYESKESIYRVKHQRGNASLSNDFHALVDYYIETPGDSHSYVTKYGFNPHHRGNAYLSTMAFMR